MLKRLTLAARIGPSSIALAAVLTGAVHATPSDIPTLTGWAVLPAATFSDGPTSGRFAGANPYGSNAPPYAARQPVQGFSGILRGPGRDTFQFLVDNGVRADRTLTPTDRERCNSATPLDADSRVFMSSCSGNSSGQLRGQLV
jgi:hypothetical protein